VGTRSHCNALSHVVFPSQLNISGKQRSEDSIILFMGKLFKIEFKLYFTAQGTRNIIKSVLMFLLQDLRLQ
jgi:hypothetical protein